MYSYLVKRIIQSIFVIIGVSIVIFVLIRVIPGDAARLLAPTATQEELVSIRERLGLNEPIYIQYYRFIKDMVKGNFGESFYYKKPVIGLILQALPKTIFLIMLSLIFALIVSLPLGILAGIKPNSIYDKCTIGFSLITQSMPIFWVGLMLILGVAIRLQLLPAIGYHGINYVILPSITLSISLWAYLTQCIRVNINNVMQMDFIKASIARGISFNKIVFIYAFKNVVIPLLMLVSSLMAYIFGGAMITEYIFNYPGIGLLILNAIFRRDYPLLQILVILLSIGFMIINLIVDMLNIVIDPRMRSER